jgi:hypothetical protein
MTTEKLDKLVVKRDYTITEVKSVFPKKRQKTFNLNGWGYNDSIFAYQNGQLMFTGNR